MSLGMDGAWDAFRKLEWEVAAYKREVADKVPSHAEAYRDVRFPMYTAINAASTAWSLVEWVWFEVELNDKSRAQLLELAGAAATAELPQLKHSIRASSSAINACHQIAHAAKHAQLRDVTAGFSASLTYDLWIKAGWHYWSVRGLVCHGEGAVAESLDNVFDTVVDWWRDVLIRLAIPDRALMVPGAGDVR